MTTYESGTTVPLRFTVTDEDGVPTAADTAVLTVTRPDGGSSTVPAAELSAGQYDYDCTDTTLPGRYTARFVSADPTLVITETFDIWPANPRLIISLSDLRAELNVPAGVTVNDDELRLYIASTTAVVEEIVGRVLATTVTETFDGGKTAVLLSERATSVTSVTVNGVATTNYVANLDSGIVYAGSTSSPQPFTSGRQNVVVTYVAGGTAVDPSIVLAARIIAAHQYQVGQQGRTGRGRPIDETRIIGSGYAVPTRALQLLGPSMAGRMPGFA